MGNIESYIHDDGVERLNNDVYVQAGNYCVAIKDIEVKNAIIPKGETLLIQSLSYAHELIHHVEVSAHPRHHNDSSHPSKYKFLFEDFCDKFEVISAEEGFKIRNKEMQALQAIAMNAQAELFQAQSNPSKMMEIALDIYSRRLESSQLKTKSAMQGSVDAVNLLGASELPVLINDFKESLNQQRDILEIQGSWLAEQQSKIQEMFNAILPYGYEMAKAPSSSMQEINRSIEKRQRGLETFEVYLGKEVTVTKIKEGLPADPNKMLTVVQERLYGDIELSLHSSKVIYLDANNLDILWDELRDNQKLVNQIFPTDRCVLLMASNKRQIDYGNSYDNLRNNKSNKSVFVMVRNGENIFKVESPISTHLKASRLFPSQEYIERHLFKGAEKIEIDIDDLEYSDRLDHIEQEILHFKRFLLLIAGLDHREKLFGQFYPENEAMNFFYPAFQEKYMNFIYDLDGEGMLPTLEEKTPSLNEYFARSNSKIKAGSRIAVNLQELITPDSAPACYVKDSVLELIKRYGPEQEFMVANVQQDSEGFYIKVPVVNHYKGRQFNARVSLSRNLKTKHLICIDNLRKEDIEFYINSRKHRAQFMDYLDLFKYLVDSIDELYAIHLPLIQLLEDSLVHIHDNELNAPKTRSNAIYESINATIISHQVDHVLDLSTKADKKLYEHILMQLSLRASPSLRQKYISSVEKMLDTSETLLKISIDDSNCLIVYTTSSEAENLKLLGPNFFTLRSVYTIQANGSFKLKKSSNTLIDQYINDEFLLKEYPAAEPYTERKNESRLPQFTNYLNRKSIEEYLLLGGELLKAFYSRKFTQDQARLIVDSWVTALKSNKYQDDSFKLKIPLFMYGDDIYSVGVSNTYELVSYLVKKFDLDEYLADQHDIEITTSSKDKYDLNIMSYWRPIINQDQNWLGRDFKIYYTLKELLVSNKCNLTRSTRLSSFKQKIDASCFLENAINSIDNDINFKNTFTPGTSSYLKSFAPSSLTLDDLMSYRKTSLDAKFGNPLYGPKTRLMSTQVICAVQMDDLDKNIKSAQMHVFIDNAGDFDDNFGSKISELCSSFRANITKFHSYSITNLVGHDAPEKYFQHLIEKLNQAFFESEKLTRDHFLSTNTQSLKDMKIEYQQGDAIHLINQKTF